MTNEEKASEIVIKIQNSSSLDYDGRRAKYMYDSAMEMAKWKDEELKKDLLELDAKNDVLESCLRDAKDEIERLRHRIVVENTYRMQIENAVRSLPQSVKDLIETLSK